MKNYINNISIREKQAYAALCLAKFCGEKGLYHQDIKKLIEYLLSLLIKENIVSWEQEGSGLSLSGRGDPIPNDLQNMIGDNNQEVFHNLVESVVEVGLSDMYGNFTQDPLKYTLKCIKILEENRVIPPNISKIFNLIEEKSGDGMNEWGETFNEKEYQKIVLVYRNYMEGTK